MLLCTACAPDPWDQVIGTLCEIETVMRQNVDNPDRLMTELDRVIVSSGPVLEDAHRRIINGSASEGERKLNVNKKRLLEITGNITDLDLEIQDRLKDDPQKLNAYIERVNRLGVLASE